RRSRPGHVLRSPSGALASVTTGWHDRQRSVQRPTSTGFREEPFASDTTKSWGMRHDVADAILALRSANGTFGSSGTPLVNTAPALRARTFGFGGVPGWWDGLVSRPTRLN
ncbi:MAG: hypothetical protein M3Q48_00915, partial [Actinomycetota bacterium]|nr:hypothetical protein [Actinomycetota bacterium]